MEKISVVIPMYNAKKYIKKTLSSILAQTYKNFEVIIVDDGSTDGSGEICDQISLKDSRIKVIHKKNAGSFLARQDGIRACSNDGYICFCDADDVMPENAFEQMINAIGDSDMLIGNIGKVIRNYTSDANNDRPFMNLSSPITVKHKDFVEEYYSSWFGITNLPVSLCAKLFKSKLIKKVSEITPTIVKYMSDDLMVTMHAVFYAESIAILPSTLYYYRPCGGTKKYMPTLYDDWKAAYNYRCNFIRDNRLPKSFQMLLDIEYCNMMFSCFENFVKSKKFSKEDIIRKIESIRSSPEVKKSLTNSDVDAEKFINVKKLKEANSREIYEEIHKRMRKKAILRTLKNFLQKFS